MYGRAAKEAAEREAEETVGAEFDMIRAQADDA